MNKLKVFLGGFGAVSYFSMAAQAMCNQAGGGMCPLPQGGGAPFQAAPLVLISLVGGYWALTAAKSQAKPLNWVGKLIGILVIVISLAGIVCTGLHGLCRLKQCHGGKMACPMSAAMPMEKAETPEPSRLETEK